MWDWVVWQTDFFFNSHWTGYPRIHPLGVPHLRTTSNFYRDLPALPSFADAYETRQHVPLPLDWWVVIADVIGSTQAIAAGGYKQVNTVGVACIAAVLNVDRATEIPFVFGGDGANFSVPSTLVDAVIPALRGAQAMARSGFGLELRVGLLQVANLKRGGFWVNLAKVRLSVHQTQAAFSGGGWVEAERRIKSEQTTGLVRIREQDGPTTANFDGFECRWKAVPQFNGHKLSLLVAATSPDPLVNIATYQSVTEKIRDIYGEVAHYHPLRPGYLRLSLSPRKLRNEWKIRTHQASLWQSIVYAAKLLLQNLAGMYLFARELNTEAVRWSAYRVELVENTDFRKFDGVLRMVIDGSDAQATALTQYLQDQFDAGHLAFGMFKSSELLLTCLVQSYNGKHLHFVDGSDGGYALAAIDLKQQLTILKSRRPSA